MSDISLHTISISNNEYDHLLKDIQGKLVNVMNLLGKIQRDSTSNRLTLSNTKIQFNEIKDQLVQLDQDVLKIPYSDNMDLENQTSLSRNNTDKLNYVIVKLKRGVTQSWNIYNQLKHDIMESSPPDVNLDFMESDQGHEEDSTNFSHGILGGVQYVIEHTPLTAEAVELQQQEALEREREIEQITQSVQDINLIFHDLDSLVINQGTLINSIEDNLFDTRDQLQGASSQLNKAEKWQRRSSTCLRLSGLIGVVILMIIILVILA